MTELRALSILFVAFSVAAPVAAAPARTAPVQATTSHAAPKKPAPRAPASSVERRPGYRVERAQIGDVSVDIVRLDPTKNKIKLYWEDASKTENRSYQTLDILRAQLVRSGETFLMATNSGIYDRQYRPLGLHVENGKQLRPLNLSRAPGGNFSMVPNGVFAMTANGALVMETTEYAKRKPAAIDASQSGPLLVIDGKLHPKFTAGSTNLKLRSGVGVDSKGQVVFAVSNGLVSFYDFAQLYRDTLDCPNALYLDGTISELLLEQDPAREQFVPFVGIWAATAKP